MARPDRKDKPKPTLRRRRAEDSAGGTEVTSPAGGSKALPPNPSWFVPVMCSLMIIGLLWLVTYYLTAGAYPVGAWHNWNLLIGFTFIIAGFLMTTRWR